MRRPWLDWLDAQSFLVAAVSSGAGFGLILWAIFALIGLGDGSLGDLLVMLALGVLFFGPLTTERRRSKRR